MVGKRIPGYLGGTPQQPKSFWEFIKSIFKK
jgi:hypothetical protein